MFCEKSPKQVHISCSSDKGRCHIIYVFLNAEQKILLISLTEILHIQYNIGYINPLVIADFSTIYHAAADLCIGSFLNLQADDSIINQDKISFFNFFRQVGIRDIGFFLISHHLLCRQRKPLSRLYDYLSAFKIPGPYFRSLGIQHDSSRNSQFIPDFTEVIDGSAMTLMVSVGKIYPCHIHARKKHLFYHLFIRRSWTQRTYNLGFSHFLPRLSISNLQSVIQFTLPQFSPQNISSRLFLCVLLLF